MMSLQGGQAWTLPPRHSLAEWEYPVAAKSPCFSPRKAKLSCSTSNGPKGQAHLLSQDCLGKGEGRDRDRGKVGIPEEIESSVQPGPQE